MRNRRYVLTAFFCIALAGHVYAHSIAQPETAQSTPATVKEFLIPSAVDYANAQQDPLPQVDPEHLGDAPSQGFATEIQDFTLKGFQYSVRLANSMSFQVGLEKVAPVAIAGWDAATEAVEAEFDSATDSGAISEVSLLLILLTAIVVVIPRGTVRRLRHQFATQVSEERI